MKHRTLGDDGCAIARSLDVIGDWWSLLIIRDAMAGKRRFGEFRTSLGLARNILSARLKKLVEDGILTTTPAADGKRYQDYVLTEKGERLYVVITALWQWGEDNCFAPGELKRSLVDRADGRPLAPIELHAAEGRLLGPGDIRLTQDGEVPAAA